MGLVAVLLLALQTPDTPLSSRIAVRIAASPARAVGVYFRDLTTGDSLLLGAGLRFHAASTMKVPAMIQLFRDQAAGLLSLDDSIPIANRVPSIVDDSPYSLDIRELVELMETVSSNLATNLLIARVGAARANTTSRALGADSILVLRGVEDGA